jgi:hypothetical protein
VNLKGEFSSDAIDVQTRVMDGKVMRVTHVNGLNPAEVAQHF